LEPPRQLTKKLRKKINHYISTTNYRDQILAEIVCRIDRADIEEKFKVDLKNILSSQFPDVEKGLVLVESLNRGRGSYQRLNLPVVKYRDWPMVGSFQK